MSLDFSFGPPLTDLASLPGLQMVHLPKQQMVVHEAGAFPGPQPPILVQVSGPHPSLVLKIAFDFPTKILKNYFLNILAVNSY